MSHFSKIRTEIKDEKMLLKCLKKLGLKVKKKGRISGHEGTQKVDFVVRTSDGNNIGFVRDIDGAFQIVADWHGIKDAGKMMFAAKLKKEFYEIQNQIRREYALKTVLEKTEKQGFNVIKQEEESDGAIRLVVRRWK